MIGPDVGSFRNPEVLAPGKSLEFPFRLNDSGQMRLRLSYWNGSLPGLNCHAPRKGAKQVTSAYFTRRALSSAPSGGRLRSGS